MSRWEHCWGQAPWRRCMRRLQAGAFPHAALVFGEAGLGAAEFARRLAQALLCETPAEPPCGECRACRLWRAGAHPDFYAVEPEKEGGDIRVEQIRDMFDFLVIARHYARAKLILIPEAERMNRAAANALLKPLEEPPAGAVFVLATRRLFMLPATIRSRCQIIRLAPPARDDAVAWLAAAAGLAAPAAAELLDAASQRPLEALAAARAAAGGETAQDERAAFRADVGEFLRGGAALSAVAEKWSKAAPVTIQERLLDGVARRLRAEHQRAVVRPAALESWHAVYARQVARCRAARGGGLDARLLLESALFEMAAAARASRQDARQAS